MRWCRLNVAEGPPFACPAECLFFEGRVLSTAGWATESDKPMSNTSLGLAALPPPGRSGPPSKSSKGKKKGRRDR
jgi:hypothetical protein